MRGFRNGRPQVPFTHLDGTKQTCPGLLAGVVSTGVTIAFLLIPSLVSKRTRRQEQRTVCGVTQSLGSLARVPGPLVAGFMFDQFGPASPSLPGAALMAFGFVMTLLVYRENRHEPTSPEGA